jgi:hypothetical protein
LLITYSKKRNRKFGTTLDARTWIVLCKASPVPDRQATRGAATQTYAPPTLKQNQKDLSGVPLAASEICRLAL